MAGFASPLSLEGRTAVVLGGTSGIGRAISLGLAAAGADVVASARRAAEVADTADAIEAAGRKTLRLTADVTKRDTLEALRDATLAAFGKVDILVNCAGKTKRLPATTTTKPTWNDILDDQPDRHAARLSGLRRADAGPRLRTHHQHRLADDVRCVLRGRRLRAPARRRCVADPVARRRVGAARRHRQRHRARRLPDRAEPDAARRHRRAARNSARTPGGRFGNVDEVAGAAVFLASERPGSSTATSWSSTAASWRAG